MRRVNAPNNESFCMYFIDLIIHKFVIFYLLINRLENDMNASVPNLSTTNPDNISLTNLLTTAQSSPNLSTPTTINIANVTIIDDESMPMEESRSLSEIPLSDQQQKQTDETSDDEDMDDDEHCQLKRPKSNNQQIQPPIDHNGKDSFLIEFIELFFSYSEEDEDEEEEEPDEEEPEQDEVSHRYSSHKFNKKINIFLQSSAMFAEQVIKII
jgi:hypothetical protein